MAYGVSLINESGIPALDMEHQCLRVYETGTTVDQRPLYDAAVLDAFDIPGMVSYWAMLTTPLLFSPSGSVEILDVGSNRYALVPAGPEGVGGGWSAFYQITDGLHLSVETELDLDPDDIPARTWCTVNGERPYKLTAPVSKTSYDETYGVQIFSEAGDKVFDSRDDFLAVRYAFIIPKAIVDDVLTNGTTRTVTLPEAMPDAWFSIPLLCSWWQKYIRTSGGGVHYYRRYRVTITQTSDTEVTITRWDSGELSAGTSMPPFPYYSHDIVAFVARND